MGGQLKYGMVKNAEKKDFLPLFYFILVFLNREGKQKKKKKKP
jgi:hypothetical protein